MRTRQVILPTKLQLIRGRHMLSLRMTLLMSLSRLAPSTSLRLVPLPSTTRTAVKANLISLSEAGKSLLETLLDQIA